MGAEGPGSSPLPTIALPAEEILAAAPGPSLDAYRHLLGHSRQGREIHGFRFGQGPLGVSLIAGCHADEPVGPALLDHLVAYLVALPQDAPALGGASWWVVPHVNPDGEARNAPWTGSPVALTDSQGRPDLGYDLSLYLQHVVRELPGDDVEFGFPTGTHDLEARPENRAVASFLRRAAVPFHFHASLHGMAFASGPWFLLEEAWIDRTVALRDALTEVVQDLGYALFDADRRGEKGFRRIGRGFTTRPDSGAMRRHFLERGDAETAGRFRPSSMELARSLGGDPLTVVSEMPLFLVEPLPGDNPPPLPLSPEGKSRLLLWIERLRREHGAESLSLEAARRGLRAMPIRDQMRLQLALLEQGVETAARALTAHA